MTLIDRWDRSHCLCRFSVHLWPSDQYMSVWNIVPAHQLLDQSRTHPLHWWGDHFDDVVINELGQRGSIVHPCFVPSHDPIFRRGVTFDPVLRYDPLENLVGSRADQNTITIELVLPFPNNPPPLPFPN